MTLFTPALLPYFYIVHRLAKWCDNSLISQSEMMRGVHGWWLCDNFGRSANDTLPTQQK